MVDPNGYLIDTHVAITLLAHEQASIEFARQAARKRGTTSSSSPSINLSELGITDPLRPEWTKMKFFHTDVGLASEINSEFEGSLSGR